MGELATIDVADNAALQRAVSDAIARAQAADPLAPVTLDRGLSRPGVGAASADRREPSTRGSGLANVRAMTLLELLSGLADRIGVTSPASTDPLLEAAVVEALLRAETGPLSASADHPETALRLAALADELAWCRLGDDVDALATTASPSRRGPRSASRRMRDPRSRPPSARPRGPRPRRPSARRSPTASLSAADLGSLIVTCARVPAPVRDVLDALAEHAEVSRVVVSPDPSPIPARVLDFPDPATETDFAVRLAADAIAAGTSPGRVAILYSADAPYARLLERALDDAGIAWHGPTGQTLQSTTVARCLFALADLAAARADGGSGITRPLLMRLLALGHLSGGPAPVASGPSRALIRQEGLFGDARNWLGHLEAIGAPVDADADDPDEAKPRHINRLAPHAAAARRPHPRARRLARHDRRGRHLDRPGLSPVVRARVVPPARHVVERPPRRRRDRRCGPLAAARGIPRHRRPRRARAAPVRGRCRGDDRPHPGRAARPARRVVRRHPRRARVEQPRPGVRPRRHRRRQRGSAAPGARRGPAAAGCRAAAPAPTTRRPAEVGRARGTHRAGRSRGRAVSRLLRRAAVPRRPARTRGRACPVGTCPPAIPSAWRPRAPASSASRPPSHRPTSPSAWRCRARLPTRRCCRASPASPRGRRPSPDRTSATSASTAAPGRSHDRDLSASGIEQFLHCPYHFFVQRILGFSTDEFEDTVDTIAPSDMGTLLHSAFERFVEQSRADGTLPEAGQAWPASALDDLRRMVDAEVDAATIKGLTGWRPAWERSYEVVMASLPEFLEVDAAEVRGEPPTAPVAAEQGFGFDGDPVVEFRVTDDVVVRLRGSIDRVDLSDDGGTVGVVDYKSGRSERLRREARQAEEGRHAPRAAEGPGPRVRRGGSRPVPETRSASTCTSCSSPTAASVPRS